MGRTATLLLLIPLASCAHAPRPSADRAIDVWLPESASEEMRKEVAEALRGQPPPRFERLPPHRIVRHVWTVSPDPVTWKDLILLAQSHARAAGGDAVLVEVAEPGPPGPDVSVLDGGLNVIHVEAISILRYVDR